MSDLDDLAAANASRSQPVPVRRVAAPPVPVHSDPQFVVVTAPPITVQKTAGNQFTAGFFGTFGVMAAIVVVLGVVAVGIYLLATAGSVARDVARPAPAPAPAPPSPPRALTPQDYGFGIDQPRRVEVPPRVVATPKPPPKSAPSPVLSPPVDTRTDPKELRDAVELACPIPTSNSLPITVKNKSGRAISDLQIGVYSDDKSYLGSVVIPKLEGKATAEAILVEQQVELPELCHGRAPVLKVIAGRW